MLPPGSLSSAPSGELQTPAQIATNSQDAITSPNEIAATPQAEMPKIGA